LNLLQRPKHLDDGYDWDEGLTNQNENRLYEVVPKLWPMGKVGPNKHSFLLDVFFGML
jgi:hypothetical protein